MSPKDALTLINCLLVLMFKSVCHWKQIKCIRVIFFYLFHAAVRMMTAKALESNLYYTAVFVLTVHAHHTSYRPLHPCRYKIQLFIWLLNTPLDSCLQSDRHLLHSRCLKLTLSALPCPPAPTTQVNTDFISSDVACVSTLRLRPV